MLSKIDIELEWLFFFYQLFWTQTCPEGMGMNGTHRSHGRCSPYPIPQPVKVGHTTGVYDPYSFQIVIFELVIYVPKEQISESTVTRDLRFSSLSKKTRKPNHLQMSLQRQHFLLSYLKTLSVGLAGV